MKRLNQKKLSTLGYGINKPGKYTRVHTLFLKRGRQNDAFIATKIKRGLLLQQAR